MQVLMTVVTSDALLSLLWPLMFILISDRPILIAAGARKHLEKGHTQHMRTTVARHKLAAERGADPDPLREVQAYIQVRGGRQQPTD
jgi:hypothetical protein